MAELKDTDKELPQDYEQLNNALKITPKDDPKDRVGVVVGDDKQPDKFYPQVKLMRCKVCGKGLTNGNKVYCSNECKYESMRGHTPWNKGVTGYSTSWKGRHHSEEAKRKMRNAKLGKTLSKEHKKNISNALKGRMPKNINDLDNSGSNSHWWKGGVTEENELARKSKEYRKWREEVYERDNYKCQRCHENNRDLHPHHVLNFAEYRNKRFDVGNGITLCGECHRDFHKMYGMEDNNREQLEEFLCQK